MSRPIGHRLRRLSASFPLRQIVGFKFGTRFRLAPVSTELQKEACQDQRSRNESLTVPFTQRGSPNPHKRQDPESVAGALCDQFPSFADTEP